MCQALERDFSETDKGDRISSIWRKNARTSQGHTAMKERIMQHEKDRFFKSWRKLHRRLVHCPGGSWAASEQR